MSPFEILGIRPTASIAEAEAAYRSLLRACHPDLHAQAGPDAVAWAEQRTRQLNAAIAAIRTRQTVSVGGGRDDFAERYGFDVDPNTDWFGTPLRERPSIACVLCGVLVDDPTSYRAHLLLDHLFVERLRRRNRFRSPNWLSWVPAPMFGALVLLIAYGAGLFAALGDSTLSVVGLWVGIVAYLLFLPFAYRAERYRRRI